MDIKALVSQMTLEEKAGLCSGDDFWHTKAVERLGIPRTMVSDGPHGLRKQDDKADHLGINDSIKAVCFPAACAFRIFILFPPLCSLPFWCLCVFQTSFPLSRLYRRSESCSGSKTQ